MGGLLLKTSDAVQDRLKVLQHTIKDNKKNQDKRMNRSRLVEKIAKCKIDASRLAFVYTDTVSRQREAGLPSPAAGVVAITSKISYKDERNSHKTAIGMFHNYNNAS